VDAADGTVRARNYVNLDVRPRADVLAAGGDLDALAPETVETETGYAVRFAPEAFADTSWPQPVIGRGQAKFAGAGAGWVEYVLPLPEAVRAAPERVRRLWLRFEAAARNARSRLAWPDYRRVLSTDYPQTEARKRPTDLAVSIGGVPLGTVRLPDDPADARGVLSLHLHEDWDYASYGYLTTLEAGQAAAARVLNAARDGQVVVRFEVPQTGTRGGLTLYGERMGATPVAPTLFVDLST
jgi:hypothetical protein